MIEFELPTVIFCYFVEIYNGRYTIYTYIDKYLTRGIHGEIFLENVSTKIVNASLFEEIAILSLSLLRSLIQNTPLRNNQFQSSDEVICDRCPRKHRGRKKRRREGGSQSSLKFQNVPPGITFQQRVRLTRRNPGVLLSLVEHHGCRISRFLHCAYCAATEQKTTPIYR